MGRAIAAALVAVLAQGCTAARTAPAPQAPESSDLPSAAQLITALQQRRSDLDGLRTLARLRYQSPGGSESARNVLAVGRPDRIRFEVVSMLGSMLVLTSENGNFAAYVPRESTLYRGVASPKNLSQYLPLDVTVGEIVDLVLATPPMFDGQPSAVDREDGLIRLTQRTEGTDGIIRVTCFSDDITPVRYREIDRHGRTTLEARYADIDSSAAVPVARQMTVRFPLTNEVLDISMKSPEINPDLPSGFFAPAAPTDTREVDLDGAPY